MKRPIAQQTQTLISLGNAIRTRRLARDLSQRGLALLAHVDSSVISRIERGKHNVRIRTLAKVAKALHVSIARLLKSAGL